MKTLHYVTRAVGVASVLAVAVGAQAASAGSLLNGSFEDDSGFTFLANDFVQTDQSNVPGWSTTASDGLIEIWQAPGPDAGATPAYLGDNFAELNATQSSALFQDVSGFSAGELIGWEFAHRGRTGVDTMELRITDLGLDDLFGTSDDVTLFSDEFSTGMDDWAFYSSSTSLLASGNDLRFSYAAVSTANGDLTTGNFIDAAAFGVGVGVSPVPVPPAFALLIGGFAALGAVGRRRGAKTA